MNKFLSSLDLLIHILIQQYFLPTRGVIFFSSALNTDLNMAFGIPVININSDDKLLISKILFNNYSCQNFILNIQKPALTFQRIEEELYRSGERFNRRNYIIIVKTFQDVTEIFKTKELNFITNILVIYLEKSDNMYSALYPEDNKAVFSFWTHQYTEKTENLKPSCLDKWFAENNSFMNNINLFPNKLKNIQRKTIKLGTFDYAPYVVLENTTAGPVILGTDIKIVSTFKEHINGTLEIVIQNDLWGNVFENGSHYGLRGNLVEDKIDIGAAAMFLSSSAHKYFDYSNIYLNSELTCLVPAPRLAALWLSSLFYFKGSIWIVIILSYTFIGLTVFCINYVEEYKSSHDNASKHTPKIHLIQKTVAAVTKPLLSQAISENQFYKKPLLALVLISTMILSVVYNCGLASLMTTPVYENSIETLDDFLNSDIAWGGLQVADWIFAWRKEFKDKYRRAAKRYVAGSKEELRQISLQGNFAFKIERIFEYFHIDPYLQEDIVHKYKPMKEFLWQQYCVFIFRRNSVLLPEFNKVLLRIIESGLVPYWTQEAANYRKSAFQRKLQILKLNSKNTEIAKLKLIHLSSLFDLWIMGNVTALVVFLVEIFHKKKHKRHISSNM